MLVAFNKYATDSEEEIETIRQHCNSLGVGFAVNNAFCEGGKGAEELAALVVNTIEKAPSKKIHYTYKDTETVEEKIKKVATKIYGASLITFSSVARKKIALINELGYDKFPICIAKTQYSFSTDAKKYGVAKNFELHVRDIVINAGAEMNVVIAGDIMRMPGLPKVPQAQKIDIVNNEIEGLS